MKIYFCVLAFILGACFGSFSNVLIYRLPKKISLVYPPSTCPKCNRRILFRDNIPILAYIFLKGRCRFCGEKISPIYVIVEALNAFAYLTFVLIFYETNILLGIVYSLAFSALIVVAFIDFYELEISDLMLMVLLILGVLLTIFSKDILFYERLIGFLIGGGVLLLVYVLGQFIKKREVMGIGDIKLMSVCGLLIGWKAVIFALFFSVIFASIVLLIIQTKVRDRNREFPFAPFLVLGTIVSMFVGNMVLDCYIQLL